VPIDPILDPFKLSFHVFPELTVNLQVGAHGPREKHADKAGEHADKRRGAGEQPEVQLENVPGRFIHIHAAPANHSKVTANDNTQILSENTERRSIAACLGVMV
jgi:hypothetical protein